MIKILKDVLTYSSKKKELSKINDEFSRRKNQLDEIFSFNGIDPASAVQHHCDVRVLGNKIAIKKGSRQILIGESHAIYLHDLIPFFDLYFSQVAPISLEGVDTVDFSGTRKQILLDSGLEFYFSSLAEGSIAFNSYIFGQPANKGDLVLDAGAYCGVSTYFFSKMVGPGGKVVALEPDEENYKCLLKNIELHQLKNVIPIKGALWSSRTQLEFFSEGCLGSAPSVFAGRPGLGTKISVEAYALRDLLNIVGKNRFDYVKMDIEGAEIESLQKIAPAELSDICRLFSIASYHIVDGRTTAKFLEPFFVSHGYQVSTDAPYGRPTHGGLVTWASKK